MQEELKRSNSIGDSKGIRYFASTTLKNGEIEIEAARQICSFVNGIRLNFNSAIAFFSYLDFIYVSDNTLAPTDSGKQLYSRLDGHFEEVLCEICLKKVVEDKHIHLDAIKYDASSECYYVQKHCFPFDSAVFRNVLIQLGALTAQNDGSFLLAERYEELFAKVYKVAKHKMSLETLKRQLAKQSAQGEAAELFVLELEQKRLSGSANTKRIKRISEIDVAAGYDIVSFDSGISLKHDRFIEVKSYYGRLSFYWSENEIKIASSLGDKYFIYLINIEEISTQGYYPIIIQNPAETVLNSGGWLIQPTTYRVLPTD